MPFAFSSRQVFVALSFSLSFGLGCADSQTPIQATGLRSLAWGDDGVEAFLYEIRRCGSDEIIASTVAPLVAQTLPGTFAALVDRPFVAGSVHEFADHFQTLAPGCYDVQATPQILLDSEWTAAKLCLPATAKDTLVHSGATTEILLISQCLGTDPGALDAIAALNHDPEIITVSYPLSKFSCGEPVTLCLDMSDPDGDPLLAQVTFDDDVPCWAQDVVDGCTEISCTVAGTYHPIVRVYDLTGSGERFEDVLHTFGAAADVTSHAELRSIVHINGACPESTNPLDACREPACGVERDCGWNEATRANPCVPGEVITVGCTCGYGGLGECAGDTQLRICDGATDCMNATALAQGDDDLIIGCELCSSTSFVCPASAAYTVLVAPFCSGEDFTCVPAALPL